MLSYSEIERKIMNNNELRKKINAQKKKILKELKQEITTLEEEIKHEKQINKIITTKRNIKISLRYIQWLAPYILTAGIMAYSCKLLGYGLPFYSSDQLKISSRKMKEFDNLGNIRYEQQYDDFESKTNTISFYHKWQKDNNGIYTRIIETYKLDDLDESEILNLLTKEALNLSDIFNSPIYTKKETNYTPKEEELSKGEYLQVVIYSIDEEDYIIRKETTEENLSVTIIYIAFTALTELFIATVRNSASKFNLKRSIYEIKKQYPNINNEVLIKKLEIKKDNYNTLTKK